MPETKKTNKKNKFLLSTDTLSGYWLDLIFQIASKIWFDWIDLALRKNFDARNDYYVKKLIEKYNLPVYIIQTSRNVNRSEMNYAVDLAKYLWVDTININSPSYLNLTAYKFITKDLNAYKKHNPSIKFSLINASGDFIIVPKYRFSNISEIIKKYKFYLALDIAQLKEEVLDTIFLRKIWNYIPYISSVYVSDKSKSEKPHIPLWEWVLKLPAIFRKFKQYEYDWYFSLKLDLTKRELADIDKVEVILKKCKMYFKEHYEDLVIK